MVTGQSRASGRVSGQVALVARKRGHVYYARYRHVDGRTAQKRLGYAWTERGRPPEGWHTRRTAEAALQALLTDVRRGLIEPPSTERRVTTFGDACAEWLRYTRDDRRVRRSTYADYARVVRAHLLSAFGADTPLADITSQDVERWRDGLLRDGRSARTAAKLLTNLNGVFRRAQHVYDLPANPLARVERVRQRGRNDFRLVTPNEVEAVARAAELPGDGGLIRVAAYTGLRLGELRALRWCDVDFEKRLVHVRHNYVAGEYGLPKSGRVRSVPLIDQASAAFETLSRRAHFTGPDDLVFGSSVGQPFEDSQWRRRFAKAVATAGVPRMRFHDLRHCFATIAVQAWPLTAVQAFLGHADIQTTMIYVHHAPQHDAAEKLSRLVATALTPLATADNRIEAQPLLPR